MEGMLLLLLMVLAVPVLLGVALIRIGRLQRRVEALEAALRHGRGREGAGGEAGREGAATGRADRRPSPAAASPVAGTPREAWEAVPPHVEPSDAGVPSTAPIDRLGPLLSRGKAAARRWLSEGNVPVKVGMLVLFAGVAALIKYATDQGWLAFSIELRLAGIAAVAILGLAFGWRQRGRRRAFALSLQGGAIGVLLMVLFAAARLYPLLPVEAAFVLSVALVAGLGVLGVRQNALALAVMGILAGFLAPLWLSTGQGHHVVLFGYYALLNVAIFAMAWYRPWRVLNLLGFVFTFVIATAWGVLAYRPADIATVQPFLVLFFVLYLLIPVFHARHRPAATGGLVDSRRVDGSLVFGTPLVAFALQSALLEGARMPLAYCALGLALVYALLARRLLRQTALRFLGQAHALLAVGFATLAVPLALSARLTASAFALEGAALIWLGLRQQRRLPQVAGVGLQLLAGLALLGGQVLAGGDARALANPAFMGALLIALAGFASAWSYRRAARPRLALAWYLWGLAWWLGNGVHEIERFVASEHAAGALLVFLALSGALLGEVHRRLREPPLAWSLAGALLLGLVLLAQPLLATPLPAPGRPWVPPDGAGPTLWAWAVHVALGYRLLSGLAGDPASGAAAVRRPVAWAQAAWLWAWPLFWSGWLARLVAPPLGLAWSLGAALLPWLLMAALLQHRPGWVLRPLAVEAEAWRRSLLASFLALLALAWLVALGQPGDPVPLPWWPLLNPLELAQWAVLLLLWQARQARRLPGWLQERSGAVLAAAGFVLLTVTVLRGLHLRADVVWSPAMLASGLVQTGLTLLWSLLGVAGWIVGSRRGQRQVWLAAAVLMAVVLAKLVLVDRVHLGNLLGIVSFIGYGLLCIGVGYVAPAPPRREVPRAEGIGEGRP
ncbi:DUF2339 domain-containing protein [Halomonas sp. LBP4]|uniref:DUF2339 domain-containing protein n=1 Tax=Halomonas sp. LBP4 TaxID=2044917 RepID=UPI000D76DBB8|nr:DUF2339 domain-containing protein [Halomonas sp. LBP4]PXX98138.1 hypothetical protein CR157_07330 [Halomonas sp. LBP4]